jgi:hypothetical protein
VSTIGHGIRAERTAGNSLLEEVSENAFPGNRNRSKQAGFVVLKGDIDPNSRQVVEAKAARMLQHDECGSCRSCRKASLKMPRGISGTKGFITNIIVVHPEWHLDSQLQGVVVIEIDQIRSK